MPDPDNAPTSDALILARVTVTRYLTGGDVIDHVSAESGEGTDLGLAEALGMMALAQHTLVETYAHADDD